MSTAPRVDVDLEAFWDDPYPVLATLRADAPVAHVPQLGATLITRRDDIVRCEKDIETFSSHQPGGLMNRLMGVNLMRKDGEAHRAERRALFPTVSPQTVRSHWTARFREVAERVLDALEPRGEADVVRDYAMPVSAEALKAMTGLTSITAGEMDAWSQAMIDGIANYVGDLAVEARCHAATAAIDRAIDDALPALERAPDPSVLSVLRRAGLPMESVRANVKLTISGGQNEPRDAIAGMVWALLTHPEEREKIAAGEATYTDAFEEYIRWISPIAMSPRRVARPFRLHDVDLEPEDRVFLMFGSANRDEAHFPDADRFDVSRDLSRTKHVAFGAGPHFCAGAWASRTLVAEIAVPLVLERLGGLALAPGPAVRFGGWAFRGPLEVPVRWG